MSVLVFNSKELKTKYKIYNREAFLKNGVDLTY